MIMTLAHPRDEHDDRDHERVDVRRPTVDGTA